MEGCKSEKKKHDDDSWAYLQLIIEKRGVVDSTKRTH